MGNNCKVDTYNFILENGDYIEVSIPQDISEKIWEDIELCVASKKFWNCSNWINVKARYKGWLLEWILMSQIVGIN